MFYGLGPGLLIWLQLGLWLHVHWAETIQQWACLLAYSPPTLLLSHRNRYVCSAEGFLLALWWWRDSVLFTHSTTKIKMALLLFSVPCDHAQRESFLNEKVSKPSPKHKPLVHEYTHTLLLPDTKEWVFHTISSLKRDLWTGWFLVATILISISVLLGCR